MSKKVSPVDRIRISKPCPADWDSMAGSKQIRHCIQCDKHVYNLSKMTRKKAEAMIEASQGRLCARLAQQADVLAVGETDNKGLRLISRRASPIAGAIVTALISISANGAHQTAFHYRQPVSYLLDRGAIEATSQSNTQGTPATLSGVVYDPALGVIPAAKLTLTNEGTGEAQIVTSSDEGTFKFFLLNAGSYTLKAEVAGFTILQFTDVTLQPGEQRQLDVSMKPRDVVTMSGVIAYSPQPLRMLYKESDLVVIAQIGESTQIEAEEEAKLMKTTLYVSSTLKGNNPETVVYVYHWIFEEGRRAFVQGDTVLMFLDERQEKEELETKDGYVLNDTMYGIKRLSEADLQIYAQRISELGDIMRQEKPHKMEIVEWLVQCAEAPATRWEGAFELAVSALSLAEREEERNNGSGDLAVSQEPVYGESTDNESGEQIENVATEDEETWSFAALLTNEHKQRLISSLLSTDKITERDIELIELVKFWNDPQLLPFLVQQLRSIEGSTPAFAEEIVTVIADIAKDADITELAEQYHQKASYDDDEEAAIDKQVASQETNGAAARERSSLLKQFIKALERKIK